MDLQASLVRNLIAPLWAKWEGSPYLRHLDWLRAHQHDSRDVVQRRQWRALKNLLRHAHASVPHYRRLLDARGIIPADIRTLETWARLPLLTKNDIREAGDDLLSYCYKPESLHRKTTSGSTGVALTIFVDEESLQWKRACTLRSDEWSGWKLGERVAKLWGNPQYLKRGLRGRIRNALLERARYLDTLKMDEAALAHFARKLIRRPSSMLFGHAHSLCLFAEFVRANKIQGIHPRGIIATAMVLHGWQRRTIEEVFDCKVTNRYGSEEVSLIACECERHDGLHICSDNVFVEIVKDGRPARPGEAGSVVVTDLTNRAMPLIRYQIGDVAVLSERQCSCGRGLPLLERLEGREADHVVLADGELISGISLTENFALQVPGIAQIQIVQETVNRFVFRIVRGPDFGPGTMERLAALVTERFGSQATYECELVESIPQEASGKYRFCISRVANPYMQVREAIAS